MMMTNWKPYIFCGVLIAVSLTAMLTLDLDIDETIFCKSVLGGSVFTIFAMRWLCKRLGLTQDRDLGKPKRRQKTDRKMPFLKTGSRTVKRHSG